MADLTDAATTNARATESLRALVGSPLADHVAVAKIDADVVVVIADSPAWASRCRFHEREIVAQICDALPVVII